MVGSKDEKVVMYAQLPPDTLVGIISTRQAANSAPALLAWREICGMTDLSCVYSIIAVGRKSANIFLNVKDGFVV